MSLNKHKKSNPQKSYIISIFISLFIVLVILFTISIPFTKKIIVLKEDIIKEKKNIENLRESSNNSETIKKELEKIDSNVHKLNTALLNNKQQISFITSLEKISESNNVSQIISNFNPEDVAKGSKEVPLSLTVTGEYLNIINYLKDIESVPYYISIRSINLKPQSENVIAFIQSITYWE